VLVWVGVGALGGIGALLRFLLDAAVSERAGSRLPWGTFVVNISGSFALGVLAGASVSGDALMLAGTATLGSYTTFSTWMFETHRLAQDGERVIAVANIVLSLALGLGAVALGRWLG
jgi:fluoride exporter